MSMRKWLLAMGLMAGGYVTENSIVALESYKRISNPGEPIKPPSTVSVVVPAWHEPDDLLEISLSSLRKQTVVQWYPELFDFIFVGCEGTNLNIPYKYGYRVLCSPRGKLRARHLGIVNATGDIVVAVDADSFYPPGWLDLMLRPFHDTGVVATTSTTWQGNLEPLVALPKLLVYDNRISGRGSAFRRWAYFVLGGFDLSVDDRYLETGDTNILVEEEEIGFKRRLEVLGKVILVDAPVIHLGGTLPRGLRADLLYTIKG
ncbi:MAG: glycosyltransferase family 2 protein [Candidatus Nanopusillus acidilobi]|jgi:cellulose synthase/poly-beta-1,6-N-acetylglucosamine synthase-like glycosyltransferase